jgi:hypothetical protein
VQDMINGLTNDVPSTLKSMSVGGSSMTMAQVIAQFQTILDLLTAVTAAKATYAAAVAAKKNGLVAARAFYENVVANLKQVFGATNQAALAPFGIPPPKTKAKPSTATRAIATVKAKVTREARGTMGKKQRSTPGWGSRQRHCVAGVPHPGLLPSPGAPLLSEG